MAKRSPMSLSLEYLNRLGWTCEIVEHWNSFAKVRKDVFTFGDILAYHAMSGIALIQTTSYTNFSARKNKISASPHAERWKAAGGKIVLHAWGDCGLREEEL